MFHHTLHLYQKQQIIAIHRRTVKDKQTLKEVILTDQELEMIDSIQNRSYPANADDPYQVNIATHEKDSIFILD